MYSVIIRYWIETELCEYMYCLVLDSSCVLVLGLLFQQKHNDPQISLKRVIIQISINRGMVHVWYNNSIGYYTAIINFNY